MERVSSRSMTRRKVGDSSGVPRAQGTGWNHVDKDAKEQDNPLARACQHQTRRCTRRRPHLCHRAPQLVPSNPSKSTSSWKKGISSWTLTNMDKWNVRTKVTPTPNRTVADHCQRRFSNCASRRCDLNSFVSWSDKLFQGVLSTPAP